MSPILGIWASQNYSRYSLPTSFESIATTTVGAGGTSTITFSSIPTTYTHLQLRVLSGTSLAGYNTGLRFNSDTGSNYYGHYLSGSGSSASASSLGSQTILSFTFSGMTNTQFAAAVVDILDYRNTNKNKTVRSLNGRDNNGSGDIYLMSGSWNNTSAITDISIVAPGANFIQYSSFALYGIKGE